MCYVYLYMWDKLKQAWPMKERKAIKGKPIKGNIKKVLLSENAMHSYGIRLCATEIEISSKCKLEQKKSSIALIHCK